jgi:hypothetical protein
MFFTIAFYLKLKYLEENRITFELTQINLYTQYILWLAKQNVRSTVRLARNPFVKEKVYQILTAARK